MRHKLLHMKGNNSQASSFEDKTFIILGQHNWNSLLDQDEAEVKHTYKVKVKLCRVHKYLVWADFQMHFLPFFLEQIPVIGCRIWSLEKMIYALIFLPTLETMSSLPEAGVRLCWLNLRREQLLLLALTQLFHP